MTGWVFYGRILHWISPRASRRQEGPSASPASMSGGGHQAEPPPWACSWRPAPGRRRSRADGCLVT